MTQDQFNRLSETYKIMDKAWDTVAAQYGFKCDGCEDNCCTSLFFHHTFIEKAFLLHGFECLTPGIKEQVLALARNYCNKTFSNGDRPVSLKLMCPLNQEGQCLLYGYRPMICRLHGLPHELHRPGCSPVTGPGCRAGCFEGHAYVPFDRTPFYKEMARVEMSFRQSTGKNDKIKETVAQMLLSKRRKDQKNNFY